MPANGYALPVWSALSTRPGTAQQHIQRAQAERLTASRDGQLAFKVVKHTNCHVFSVYRQPLKFQTSSLSSPLQGTRWLGPATTHSSVRAVRHGAPPPRGPSTMVGADGPAEDVAAIYAATMLAFLALLCAAQSRAPFYQSFILAPGIRVLLLIGVGGWWAVVWAMATGRASATAEQVFVLAAFTFGTAGEWSKQFQLCNVEWNYDMFAAVAWAQLIATHQEVQAYEQRLQTASSDQLVNELRSIYVHLVATPTVALPPVWIRCFYHNMLVNDRRSGAPPAPDNPPLPHRAERQEAARTEAAPRQDTLPSITIRSLFRAFIGLGGTWNPRSIHFAVLRGSLLLTALPFILIFALSLWIQLLRANAALVYKVQPRLARHLVRRWLWTSILAPPSLFPVSGGWDLWMFAAAFRETRATSVLCAMTRPLGVATSE